MREKRDQGGEIVLLDGCGRVFELARKLKILSDIVFESYARPIKTLISDASEKMLKEVLAIIGHFGTDNPNIKQRYLKRWDTKWEGNVHVSHDTARRGNIDKIRMTLGTISTTTSIYGDMIQLMTDFEDCWDTYPAKKDMLDIAPGDYDLRAAMIKISESRNTISAASKVPTPPRPHMIRR